MPVRGAQWGIELEHFLWKETRASLVEVLNSGPCNTQIRRTSLDARDEFHDSTAAILARYLLRSAIGLALRCVCSLHVDAQQSILVANSAKGPGADLRQLLTDAEIEATADKADRSVEGYGIVSCV